MRDQWRPRIPMFIVLGFIIAATSLWGFCLEPESTGPPGIMADTSGGEPAFLVRFATLPANLKVSEDMTVCAGRHSASCQDSIEVKISGTTPGSSDEPISMWITGREPTKPNLLLPSGTPCPQPFTGKEPPKCTAYFHAHGSAISIDLAGIVWPKSYLYARAGASGTALLPPIELSVGDSAYGIPGGKITRSLREVGLRYDNDQAVMVRGAAPNSFNYDERKWEWSETTETGGQALELTTTDPYKATSDSKNGFRSGILLGIAGAALASLAVEASRRERQPSHAPVPAVSPTKPESDEKDPPSSG